jgi:hypothetical protein
MPPARASSASIRSCKLASRLMKLSITEYSLNCTTAMISASSTMIPSRIDVARARPLAEVACGCGP